jgi:hypothetical protein
MAFKGFGGTTPAGEKRHLVSLVQPNVSGARDGSGNLLGPTTLATNVFASFEPWGKNPAKKANAPHGEVDVNDFKFVIGFMSGVTLPLQVLFNGATYKVYGIINNPEAPDFELWLFAQLVDGV